MNRSLAAIHETDDQSGAEGRIRVGEQEPLRIRLTGESTPILISNRGIVEVRSHMRAVEPTMGVVGRTSGRGYRHHPRRGQRTPDSTNGWLWFHASYQPGARREKTEIGCPFFTWLRNFWRSKVETLAFLDIVEFRVSTGNEVTVGNREERSGVGEEEGEDGFLDPLTIEGTNPTSVSNHHTEVVVLAGLAIDGDHRPEGIGLDAPLGVNHRDVLEFAIGSDSTDLPVKLQAVHGVGAEVVQTAATADEPPHALDTLEGDKGRLVHYVFKHVGEGERREAGGSDFSPRIHRTCPQFITTTGIATGGTDLGVEEFGDRTVEAVLLGVRGFENLGLVKTLQTILTTGFVVGRFVGNVVVAEDGSFESFSADVPIDRMDGGDVGRVLVERLASILVQKSSGASFLEIA